MMEVGIDDEAVLGRDFAEVRPGKEQPARGVEPEIITAIAITENVAPGDSGRDRDCGITAFDPGLDRKVLELHVRRMADIDGVLGPLEGEGLSDAPRAKAAATEQQAERGAGPGTRVALAAPPGDR